MLDLKEAANIGREACIELIGKDFVWALRDTGCFGYTTNPEKEMYVYVEVDDEYEEKTRGKGILADETPYKYIDYVAVDMETGSVRPLESECRLPTEEEVLEVLTNPKFG